MKETAIRYEYIIRAAHNVGRLEILAAHADSYRALERNFVKNRDNKDGAKSQELLFKYAFNCGEIATNLSNALWEFERNFREDLSEEDRDKLNEIEELLVYAEMESIDQAITLFEDVFGRHKLVV